MATREDTTVVGRRLAIFLQSSCNSVAMDWSASHMIDADAPSSPRQPRAPRRGGSGSGAAQERKRAMLYVFGDCTLDTQLYTLQRAGQALRLRPKVFQVLRYL